MRGRQPGFLQVFTMSLTPSTSEIIALGVPVTLRDGSRIRLRQSGSDTDLLRRGFARLSSESRYRRFLTPVPELSQKTVRYLTELDHHDHEAIVALDATGEGIGIARYIRDPHRPEAAEIAVTVIDAWQGKARESGGDQHLHRADAGHQPADARRAQGAGPGPDRGSRRRLRSDRNAGP
jgi:hypothetical protein